MRAIRPRLALAVALLLAGAAACTFGVDLDNLIDGPADASAGAESGSLVEASVPAADSGSQMTDAEADTGPPLELLQIGAGFGFTCVRKSNNTVACWGRGTEGRLGNGAASSSATPVGVLDLADVVDLSVGTNHACAVRANGTIYCWGDNAARQLGIAATGSPPAESRAPQPVSGITNAKQVAASSSFSCALLGDGTVSCWGSNGDGQLGDGTQTQRVAPVPVKNLVDVKQIAVSVTAACALTNGGDVWCWGDNSDGQAGSGDASVGDLTVPRKVEALSGVASLASGATADHLCAVLDDGTARCWGYGDTGCLGNSSAIDSALPVKPTGLADVRTIATGNGFTCAMRKNGSLSCFGSNAWRVLPTAGAPANTSVPLESALANVTAIATGAIHACAIIDKRSVQCWGADQYGALGRKRALVFDTPTKVSTTTKLVRVAAGRETVCGIDAPDAGTLSCWGLNSNRQLARSDVQITAKAAPVPLINEVQAVAPSEVHTCAVVSDGGVRCWGNGESGQLGFSLGLASIQTTPGVFVAPPAMGVGTGATFSCALLRNGEAMCAGASTAGQLGRAGSSSSVPSLVTLDGGVGTSFGGIDELFVGKLHACVIHATRQKLSCWGLNNEGQIGTIGITTRAYPAEVPLAGRPLAVATGRGHTCVVVDPTDAGVSGTVQCFGSNTSGQLSGTALSGPLPRTVPLAKARTLAAGDEHTCALLADGTVSCWGANTFGQLGDGTRADSNQPVNVTGITGATSIAAEESHTCAVTPSGTFCWGTDFSGQAGVDAVITDNLPAPVTGL